MNKQRARAAAVVVATAGGKAKRKPSEMKKYSFVVNECGGVRGESGVKGVMN